MFGWIAIVLLIAGVTLYQFNVFYDATRQVVPAKGGVFREGIIGRFTNANPVFAVGAVDTSVSKLLYSGLLKYDGNGTLVGDLAESWTIDPGGKIYTVKLKKDVQWHDKKPLTAEDVEYTYKIIQNPDIKSPFRSSWEGVEVKKTDDRTIIFTLKGSISSFPHYLTNGIIPKHIFSKIDTQQIRSSSHNNQDVIGSGPFKLTKVEVKKSDDGRTAERISLATNTNYHLGRPKINQYFIQTYKGEDSLIRDLNQSRLDAINGVSNPEKIIAQNDKIVDMSRILTSQVNVFFKVSEPPFNDVNLRKALTLAVDRKEATKGLGYPVKISDSPFLDTTFAYDKKQIQKTDDINKANALLESSGWVMNKSTGVREKAGQKLEFSLTARSLDDYKKVSESLVQQWKAIGANVRVILLDEEEMQSAIATHNYSVVLSAISLGYDPDVFAFWHSSQKNIGSSTKLNLSEYSSKPADIALEGGRSRSDPSVRAVKYAPFTTNWLNDNPALTLYQPRYVFLVREPFYNFNTTTMSASTDRYNNVHNWTVKDKKVRK